ncbi:MAG: cell division protein ZapA [Peptostreptococcales bacterium]
MEEKLKVNVRIYGQDYRIAGDASKEYMLSLASYVDAKMNEIADKGKQHNAQMLAVLSAINITDEYFKTGQELKNTRVKLDRYSVELKNKDNNLRELKNSYLQYKQDKERDVNEINTIKYELEDKVQQNQSLQSEIDGHNSKYESLKKELDKLKEELSFYMSEAEEKEREIQELMKSKQEIENAYFDTEMANVQLKKELDDLHKLVER